MFQSRRPLFDLGRVVATPGVLAAVDQSDIRAALRRHATGDWGDCDQHDREANEAARRSGSRLLSAYHDSNGTKFWIITEGDRSVTSVLLPEEY